MKKEGKRWSTEQKIKIVKESSSKGVRETLEKYGIYPATFYAWKKKLEQIGEEGFAHGMTKHRVARIKELEQEVELRKQLLAEKEIASSLKNELLKKISSGEKKILVMEHIDLGMKRDQALQISG